jgi:hypothetical protein
MHVNQHAAAFRVDEHQGLANLISAITTRGAENVDTRETDPYWFKILKTKCVESEACSWNVKKGEIPRVTGSIVR